MKRALQGALAALVVVLACMPTVAATVGNWNGSLRTWNDADTANLKGIVTTAGHTVLADAAITSGLGGATVYVIGEGTTRPTAGELTILDGWVSAGGRLLLFNNSGCSGCTATNAILTAFGSTITVSGASAVVAPFPTSPFTTTPNNLVGMSLVTSPGDEVLGGTQIAGSFISYQAHGAGYVIVFGDRGGHQRPTLSQHPGRGRPSRRADPGHRPSRLADPVRLPGPRRVPGPARQVAPFLSIEATARGSAPRAVVISPRQIRAAGL